MGIGGPFTDAMDAKDQEQREALFFLAVAISPCLLLSSSQLVKHARLGSPLSVDKSLVRWAVSPLSYLVVYSMSNALNTSQKISQLAIRALAKRGDSAIDGPGADVREVHIAGAGLKPQSVQTHIR